MRTNIMELELDAQAAEAAWSVFEMREAQGAAAPWASPLAAELGGAPFPVAGVVFCSGRSGRVLVAAPKGTSRADLVAFAKEKGIDTTCTALPWAFLASQSERDCLRLLWAMLGQDGGCRNVTGKLFTNVSRGKSWVARRAGAGSGKDKQAEAVFMEVCVGDACELALAVRSFTKRSMLLDECERWRWPGKDEEERQRKKQERVDLLNSLTGYRISGERGLVAARCGGEGPVYVQRKLMAVDDRNTVDYGAHLVDEWGSTKIGAVAELTELFRAVHYPYASISFREAGEAGRIKTYKPGKKAIAQKEAALPASGGRLAWRPDELPIRMRCAEGCGDLMAEAEAFLGKNGIPFSEDEGRLSLCCVPPKAAAGESDPYAGIAPWPAQHVTREILSSRSWARGTKKEGRRAETMVSWAGLETSLKELRIKGDVADGEIRLFDWAGLGLAETLAFSVVTETDRKKLPSAFAAVEVSTTGGLAFFEYDGSYNGDDELIGQALLTLQAARAGTWCCTSPSLGTALGTETTLTTMPDLAAMGDYARRRAAGEELAGERSAETLAALYGDTFDIAWAEEPGGRSALYYAADCHNAREKRARATRLRRIEAVDGPDIEPWAALLMPMLDVWFVKMRESTVRPFPLKYLDEWVEAKRKGFL